MLVVLDTSALSATYRRERAPRRKRPLSSEEAEAQARREALRARLREVLRALMKGDDELLVPGVALQELLSGVATDPQYDHIVTQLSRFAIGLAGVDDHKEAARLFNACAARGVIPGAVDSLIAAMTIRAAGKLLTADGDFGEIARHTSLELLPI